MKVFDLSITCFLGESFVAEFLATPLSSQLR